MRPLRWQQSSAEICHPKLRQRYCFAGYREYPHVVLRWLRRVLLHSANDARIGENQSAAKVRGEAEKRSGCHVCHGRGLTLRSSGAPTAGHQGPVRGTVYIFSARAPASCRCCPLSSNVRLHEMCVRNGVGSPISVSTSCGPNPVVSVAVQLVCRWRFAPRAEARSQFVHAATGGKSSSRQFQACALVRTNLMRPVVKYPLPYKSGVFATRQVSSGTKASSGVPPRYSPAPTPLPRGPRFGPRHEGQYLRRGKPIAAPTKPSAMQRANSSSLRRQVQPNPSLKRSTNGVPPGPRGGAGYHPPRWPGVPPLAPA